MGEREIDGAFCQRVVVWLVFVGRDAFAVLSSLLVVFLLVVVLLLEVVLFEVLLWEGVAPQCFE